VKLHNNFCNTVCAAARVIKTIPTTDNYVLGVTSVDDKLFVLLFQADNQVAVYSISDYQLLRHLNVPGLEPIERNDMTSCVRHKCLYMSDNSNRCVHRYDLRTKLSAKIKRIVGLSAGSRISKWSVPGKPCGLSVTPSCNLLVTCQGEPNKLVELSADNGHFVREIELQSDIMCPRHSVQLTTGQYVVCNSGDLRRVCVVGDDGNVTYSYGGECGSDVGQLNSPSYLAVDKDSQFIYLGVGDCFNARLMRLSPTLEFEHDVVEDLSFPCRLHFHQTTRRLFVGQWSDGVAVIQL